MSHPDVSTNTILTLSCVFVEGKTVTLRIPLSDLLRPQLVLVIFDAPQKVLDSATYCMAWLLLIICQDHSRTQVTANHHHVQCSHAPSDTTPQQIAGTLRSAILASQHLIESNPSTINDLRPIFLQFYANPIFTIILGLPTQHPLTQPAPPMEPTLQQKLDSITSTLAALTQTVEGPHTQSRGKTPHCRTPTSRQPTGRQG